MCAPVMLIGIALSAVGSLATAAMSSANAKAEAEIKQRQLRTEIENEKIKAMQDTNDRLEQFRKDEATNRAALSAMGADQNLSYQQGIQPWNKRIVSRDIRATEFNAGQEIGRKKYEISVAGWQAKSASRSAWIGAGADILGNVGSHYSNGNIQSANSITARP